MRAHELLGPVSILTLLVLAGCSDASGTQAPETDPDAPEPGEELGVGGQAVDDTIVATDLVVVGPMVKLATPPPGTGIGYVVHWGDGSSEGSMIEGSPDGTITPLVEVPSPDEGIESGSADATGSSAARSAPGACADKAYSLTGFHWAQAYAWSFLSASTPKIMSITKVEAALARAATNITTGRTDCKRTSHVTAKSSYLGRTKSKPNIRVSGSSVICDRTDGKNVVAFGPLPGQLLAITCFSWTVTAAGTRLGVEADMRIDSERRWFSTTTVPAGCSNRYMIEGTVTHELGHAFGLAHVSESAHGNLTMSPMAGPCTTRDATLGLGDVLGLEKLY